MPQAPADRRARAILALLLCAGAAGAADLSQAELGARLQARFQDDRTGACAVAAVLQGGEVLRARRCAGPRLDGGPGYGDAFEIGSISKTLTAFLVADLVAAGRWHLDDPIARHLPPGSRVPAQGERQITVRDLVTHSAGLPPLPARFPARNPADPYASLSEADLLASLADSRPQTPVGSAAAYSNFGMMVLSLAVARAYQGDFDGDLERALSARLFQPLQMDGAYIARPPAGSRLVPGHLPSGDVAAPWTWAAAPNAAGVGGVRARLDDLVRYAQAHLGVTDTPLAGRLRATQAAQAHGFGMNWMLASVAGHALVVHEGATGGHSAIVLLEPATQRAVVVLVDTALADLGGLGPLALSLLDDRRPAPKARLAQPVPPALRQALAGGYTLAGMNFRIWDQDGRLMAQATGQPAFELGHDSHGDFYPVAPVSALLTPVLESGTVNRFLWRQGGGQVQGLRTSTP